MNLNVNKWRYQTSIPWSLGEKFLQFKSTSTCAHDHLRPDVAHLRLRVREEGGGQRGHVRASGPGRGAALDPQGLRVTLYAPSPTISLCRHAEQGCGVEAKKSPVAAKGPAHERAAIVDETRENSTGGDCGAVRGGGGVSLRARDRGLGHGHGDSSQHSTQAYNFFLPFTSTIAGTRPRCRVTATTTSSAASPALEDIKSTIVIRIYSCNVPQDRVMGGRECSDIISLCSRVKSRDLSGHNAQYLSLITS